MRPDLIPLFAYGTLLDTEIQQEVFGRLLHGKPDELLGYVKKENAVAGRYPDITASPNPEAKVCGARFELDPKELERADGYETELYTRKWVTLSSGAQAWVYFGATKTSTTP